ncbi:MAG: MSMEG_0570 family nitrogen starvation response protein, partial [Solirubrobacteraceae bacterium]
VKDYLSPGQSYPLTDFLRRTTSALELASERVRRRHGFACTSAAQQLEAIERSAAAFDHDTGSRVTVLGFDE